jgi:hypothetical protein
MLPLDIKIFNHKKYARYEYHGKKVMPRFEAEEGAKWFRGRYSRDLTGKVAATIRLHREPGGWSLWQHDSSYWKDKKKHRR